MIVFDSTATNLVALMSDKDMLSLCETHRAIRKGPDAIEPLAFLETDNCRASFNGRQGEHANLKHYTHAYWVSMGDYDLGYWRAITVTSYLKARNAKYIVLWDENARIGEYADTTGYVILTDYEITGSDNSVIEVPFKVTADDFGRLADMAISAKQNGREYHAFLEEAFNEGALDYLLGDTDFTKFANAYWVGHDGESMNIAMAFLDSQNEDYMALWDRRYMNADEVEWGFVLLTNYNAPIFSFAHA